MRTLYNIFEVSIIIMQVYLILHNLLYYNISFKRLLIVSIILFIGFMILNVIHIPSIILSICIIIVPLLIFILTTYSLQLCDIGYFVSCILITESTQALLLNVIQSFTIILNISVSRYYAGCLVLLISTIIWFLIIYHINHKYDGFNIRKPIGFFVFLALVTIFNAFIYGTFRTAIYETDYAGYNNVSLISIFIVLFGIGLVAELFFILFLYYEKVHYSLVVDHTNEYLEIEKAHFTEIQKRDKETRQFRHDLQGHLIALSHHLGNDNLEKASEYLQSLTDTFTTLQPKYRTGNEVVDSLLEQKRPLIEDNQIKLELQGSLHKFERIDDFDLCTIFSNAIQNAIEACTQLSDGIERYIQISFHDTSDQYLMKFSNPVLKNVKPRKFRTPTTKSDKLNHGFGLLQIRQIALNHQGTIHISCEHNMFQLIVELHKPEG